MFLTGDPKWQQRCAGLSPPANVRSRPCGTAQLAIQAERSLPSLLHRDFLSPWAHQRGRPGVAGVALERIALQEGPSATDADRLLGDRDHRALHGDVCCPGALGRIRGASTSASEIAR